MCSRCEPDGLRGQAALKEMQEIHEAAFFWAEAGFFTYKVEWDPQAGVHWIMVIPDVVDDAASYTWCEFEAFLSGLRVASKVKDGRHDV